MATEPERNAMITRIVGEYESSVLRLAYAYLKHAQDAEDVAQDVFLAFFRAAPKLSGAEHEKAYLLRATINRCKGHFLSGWVKNRRPMPERLPERGADAPKLLEAVLSMEERYRVPLHLHYYEGYTIKEIAGLIGAKPATVGTRLSRGREALRAIIEGEGYE